MYAEYRRANLRRAFFGAGDAVIGVNPVTDDVENLTRVLDTVYGVIDKFNIRPVVACWRTSPLQTKRFVEARRATDFPAYLRQRQQLKSSA